MSRHIRVETRSRHQNDLKRVMSSSSKVRKWEKKWVRIEETTLQIFKWMPIKIDEQVSPQANTPIQQLQEAENIKENLENINETKPFITNKPSVVVTNNKSPTMQTGSATMSTGLHDINSNGQHQQQQNGTVAAQQNGDNCSHNYNRQQITNKHPLTNGNGNDNDESLLDTSSEFPPTKRQRTMPETPFLGLGGDQLQSSGPILMSNVKVIDPNDSSLHNSSSSNFSQMNPSTTLLTSTSFAQQPTNSATTDAHLTQAQTVNTSDAKFYSTSAPGLTTDNDDISQQSQADDIEMMETEMTNDHPKCTPTQMNCSTNELNGTIDMDDLSDIARAVTEQIVTKVSSYNGI